MLCMIGSCCAGKVLAVIIPLGGSCVLLWAYVGGECYAVAAYCCAWLLMLNGCQGGCYSAVAMVQWAALVMVVCCHSMPV
jgi:hypothetical protein